MLLAKSEFLFKILFVAAISMFDRIERRLRHALAELINRADGILVPFLRDADQ